MSPAIHLQCPVTVCSMDRPPSDYDPYLLNLRPPRPGDHGIVVDTLPGQGDGALYIVEHCDESGNLVWLSEFLGHELMRGHSHDPRRSGAAIAAR
jgi:hypothetical protein